MIDFLFNVTSVVAGIWIFRLAENFYDDIRWKIYQRHDSSKSPWENQ